MSDPTWPQGELLGFDLETTGVDPLHALPVAFAFVTFMGPIAVSQLTTLVQPGAPIPPETTAVHGITDEMVADGGVPLTDALDVILDRLLDASARGVPVVGMNVSYDLTIVDTLAREHRSCGLRALGWAGPVVDVAVIDRHLDKMRAGSRKLADLCGHYRVPQGRAHDALADTTAAVLVLHAMVRIFPDLGRQTAAGLTARQVRWRRAWCDDYNTWLRSKGRRPIPESAGVWPLASDALLSG